MAPLVDPAAIVSHADDEHYKNCEEASDNEPEITPHDEVLLRSPLKIHAQKHTRARHV
jgi:hypothetical protein